MQLPYKFESIKIVGKDAIDFAHRVFTRNLKSLDAGAIHACLALSPQAKLVAWFWILKGTHELQIFVEESQVERLLNFINTYQFQDELEVERIENPLTGQCETTTQSGWRGLSFSFTASSVNPTDGWDSLRFQKLIPDWASDCAGESRLVFEIGLEDLCDENKGCYIGQEVVERVRSRTGRAKQSFCHFESDSPLPPAAAIYFREKQVGQLSHSVLKISDSKFWGLGFLDGRVLLAQDSVSLKSGQPLRLIGPSVETRTATF